MTTEDDFQRALDQHPHDWQTRLVFADWLQEHNDPRADGYRALGELRRVPTYTPGCWWWADPNVVDDAAGIRESERLPQAWLYAIVGADGKTSSTRRFVGFPSRREAEDAAAVAYALYA
jgi:uncharacterized protein (TIGR02996 family)